MATAIGTAKDGAKLREQINAKLTASQNLIKETQNDIRSMSSLVATAADRKERKMKVEKLAQDFEAFHDKFKKLAQITKSKMEENPVGASSAVRTLKPSAYGDEDDADRAEAAVRRQHVVQLEDDREFQDALIRERDAEIQAIQGQMIQVNDIFKDLARLVEEQGAMVDNIQTNITVAADHVDTGVGELKQASEHQKTNRKLLIFIAIFIVVVVAIATTVIIILTTKSSS